MNQRDIHVHTLVVFPCFLLTVRLQFVLLLQFHQYWPPDVPAPFRPQSRFEVIPWEYFTTRHLYQNVEQLPSLGLVGSNRLDVDTAMKTAEVIFSQLYGGQKVRNWVFMAHHCFLLAFQSYES